MSSPGRLAYLDWLRGAAVLIMLEAHTLDAWTRPDDRTGTAFAWGVILGGMGAPLFLFLAGLSIPLAIESRIRRGRTPSEAAASVRRRGWQIFGLAFLFRLQSFVLSPGSPALSLLKVDVLNVMGPAIVLGALLWALGRTVLQRATMLSAAAAAFTLVTPGVRASDAIGRLPDVVEAYLRPLGGLSTFTFFPWAGFVPAGAVAGLVIARTAGTGKDIRAIAGCGLVGAALAAVGYAASFFPSPFAGSSFWTSSPAFFCLRVGLLTASIWAAWLWWRRPRLLTIWSPIRVLGESSLFVYWIHVEMVYGLLSQPIRRRLPLAGTAVGFFLLAGLLLLLVLAKNRWMSRQGRSASGPASPMGQSVPSRAGAPSP